MIPGGGFRTRSLKLFPEISSHNIKTQMNIKNKTYLREVARLTGMDAGNLSKLAQAEGVDIGDKAALTTLALERRREDLDSSEVEEIPLKVALDQLTKLHRKWDKKHNMCLGAMEDLFTDIIMFREFAIVISKALAPVWAATDVKDGLFLTSAQAVAIRKICDKEMPEAIERLKKQQLEDRGMLKQLRIKLSKASPANAAGAASNDSSSAQVRMADSTPGAS